MDTAARSPRRVSTVVGARVAIARIALGWGAFATLQCSGALLAPPVPAATLVVALVGIVAVIVVCAFGVVHEAEALAHRLGDPYGSLVLTLSIVLIEVVLIAAVMVAPGDHATIGRDSVMAVSMSILNLVIGLALVVGSQRHGHLVVNRRGTVAYLAMITVLATSGFALPRWVGRAGSYGTAQAWVVVVCAVVGYAAFLFRQMGPRAADFREVVDEHGPTDASVESGPVDPPRRGETVTRIIVLVATMIPIVLVSHDLAGLLDDGLGRVGAPVALSGLLIALIVFLPEGLTSVRAGIAAEAQRVSNLCHGALVSTLALTIPAVLMIGLATHRPVILAESTTNLVVLAATLALSWITFTSRRVTATHGAAHLVLFGVYAATVFV